MGEQRLELAGLRIGDVLDMVRLVCLPQQQDPGAVRRFALLGKKMRVSRRHDAVSGQEAGVSMVGMETVSLPGIMAQDYVGADPADPVGDLPSLAQPGLEFAV